MTYAIIQIQGKQYRVQSGDEIDVDRVTHQVNDQFITKDVLLVHTDDSVKIGNPLIKSASVSLVVLEQLKGEKIRVFKYKSKSRYRKTRGHRQALTRLRVGEIVA